ncbi:cysteine--tRNA ligase [Prauserella marina]|uniref:Cysteinyl-tRNA synthetase n=1 Tax=Prauserella marina TaxID=530584 RepID=A0A222VRF6_9PSEU|nr:class I tRNA ligase family protein [Prauserella marina]ASR36525.1 cysteine--tRNA ligase [Prauserella marina]PWV73915.1 cysteinyl-tRNA synthetase [Prauserella marina]SDD58838.1 cysteinyl-tRNA synthetase [Prauserella marina]
MTFESMTRKRPIAGASAVSIGGHRVRLLDRARIYACGVTPYDVTHVGQAATFLWVDTLARVLRVLGVEPLVCRNVTDVDDVLHDVARHRGTPYDQLASFEQFEFEGDMAALGVRAPDHAPVAHGFIDPVRRLAAALVESGTAYAREGSVYFRGAGVADRAGLDEETALRLAEANGGRPDDPAKDHPLDVAVWQAAEPGHPAWSSPWGRGRPGWHAGCVAMATSVFGIGVDIHAGGADLRFPHHAYHAAMAEALTGTAPYARAWLHAGTVRVGGVKMAKSEGNLVAVRDVLAEHPAPVLRLAVIDRPWHSDWDYAPSVLDAAAGRLAKLYRAAGRPGESDEAVVEKLRLLLADELDVPAAIDLATEVGGSAARLLVATMGLT